MKRYPYKATSHVVEVHIGPDIMHHDYGREEMNAIRAIDRLMHSPLFLACDRIRHWHNGSMITVYEPSPYSNPAICPDCKRTISADTPCDKSGCPS